MAKIKVDYPLKKSKSLDKALEPGNKTGFVTVMSPTDFLKHAKRLKETKEDKLLISSFKEGMKDGKKFKALKLLDHNLADGRHRATAAEELGIKKIPVIDYRESDLAKEPDGIHAVSKKSNRVGKATGGAMNLPLGSDDPNDAFRRLITWSFATAPLFHRAAGGGVQGDVQFAPEDETSRLPTFTQPEAQAVSRALDVANAVPKKEYKPFGVLPFREDESGIHFDPHAGVLGKIIGGVTAPGDVVTGKLDPMSDEGINRIVDLAGVAGGGGTAFNEAPAGSIGMFIGRNAKTADLDALREAQKMALSREGRDAIWDKTGWYEGRDKNWRSEISDHRSDFHPEVFDKLMDKGIVYGKMGDIYNHPDLYKAYPHLADLGVVVEHGAWHNPSGLYEQYKQIPGIEVKSNQIEGPNGLRSILLHELQHAVQHHEAHAPGGSPAHFTQQKEAEAAHSALTLRKEMDQVAKENPDLAGKHQELLSRVFDDYANMGAADWFPNSMAQKMSIDYENNPTKILEDLTKIYGTNRQTSAFTPMEMYKKILGEVESRNTQKRMDMLDLARQIHRPWKTQSVPDEEQLVLSPSGREVIVD